VTLEGIHDYISKMNINTPFSNPLRATILTVLLASAMLPTATFGQSAATGDSPITRVSVEGLRRTKPGVTERLLRQFIGTPAADLDQAAVIAVLLDTGIFEDIQIETREDTDTDGTLMAVTLKEKWSFIPLPVFVAASDGITAGAAVIDANAFGLNDKIFSVGLILPAGWMTSIAYVNVPDTETSLKWSVSAFFSRQDKTVVNELDEDIRRYGYDALAGSFEVGVPVWGPWQFSVAGLFKERGVRDIGEALAAPEAARVLGVQPGLSARSTEWDGVFLSERSFSLDYTWNYGLINDSYQSVKAAGVYEQPLFPGFKLGARAAGVYEADAPVVFEEAPSTVGITILPSSFSAPILAGGSLALEGRLIQFPFGTLSALLAWQTAWSDGPLLGSRFDQGPAGGIRLYVAKVAVPAVDIGAAYNLETGLFRATFGIGMRM